MVLKLICQGMLFLRARAVLFSGRGVIGSQCPGNIFFLLFFCWDDFSHTKPLTIRSIFATGIAKGSPAPMSTMISPVLKIVEGVKVNKQNKTKIGVGSIVAAKVRELEDITREGRIRRMRKEVVGCVQDIVGKKKFLVQLKYGQKIEISYSLLFF